MRETQTTIDFTAANGRNYRLDVWTPPVPAPAQGFPVLWVLDGGAYLGLASDMVRNRGVVGGEIEPAVVVAVGYPDDALADWLTRRWFDFSPTPPAPGFARPGVAYGGLEGFLDMLADEALPRVAQAAAVDTARMSLWGHSMGGLAVLHALFTRPAMFRSWLSVSPAIWWNDAVVLTHEARFVQAMRDGHIAPRIHIAVGSLEEALLDRVPSGVQATLEEINRNIRAQRVVGHATELGARLEDLPGCIVRCDTYEGETHMSVPFASMRDSLDLALPRSP